MLLNSAAPRKYIVGVTPRMTIGYINNCQQPNPSRQPRRQGRIRAAILACVHSKVNRTSHSHVNPDQRFQNITVHRLRAWPDRKSGEGAGPSEEIYRLRECNSGADASEHMTPLLHWLRTMTDDLHDSHHDVLVHLLRSSCWL